MLPLLLVTVSCRAPAPAPVPLRIAAAADMAKVLQTLGPAFRRATGRTISPTMGASGVLAHQIAEGAPFDVFVSANTAFVDSLVRDGHAVAATRTRFARGRVVAWTTPSASPVPSLSALADPRFGRIAVANPDHAPYGMAAMAALQHAGILKDVEARLVRAENVQIALRYAQTGNADVALVARGLVAGEPGHALLIDVVPEQPLDQTAVAVAGAHDPAGAAAFIDFLRGAEGRALLQAAGFEVP